MRSLLPVLFLCVACVPAGTVDTAGDPLDALADSSKTDDGSPPVLDTALGRHLSGLTIAAVDRAAVDRGAVLPGVAVLRFAIRSGQRFALVMIAEDAAFAAQLRVRVPGMDTMGNAVHQTLLPEAAASDAVFVGRASIDGSVVAVATSVAFQGSGTFSIDVVPLALDPGIDLSLTSWAPRDVLVTLRGWLPDVQRLLARGAVDEGSDGLLVTTPGADPALSPLEAANRNTVVADVNQDRQILFDALVRADAGVKRDRQILLGAPIPDDQNVDPTPAQISAVGAAWAELESALQQLAPR